MSAKDGIEIIVQKVMGSVAAMCRALLTTASPTTSKSILKIIVRGRCCFHTYFVDGETEAQRDCATYSSSSSW